MIKRLELLKSTIEGYESVSGQRSSILKAFKFVLMSMMLLLFGCMRLFLLQYLKRPLSVGRPSLVSSCSNPSMVTAPPGRYETPPGWTSTWEWACTPATFSVVSLVYASGSLTYGHTTSRWPITWSLEAFLGNLNTFVALIWSEASWRHSVTLKRPLLLSCLSHSYIVFRYKCFLSVGCKLHSIIFLNAFPVSL